MKGDPAFMSPPRSHVGRFTRAKETSGRPGFPAGQSSTSRDTGVRPRGLPSSDVGSPRVTWV